MSNANSNKYIQKLYSNSKNCTFAVTIELTVVWSLDKSEFKKSVLFVIFYVIRPYVTSVNNVVVTVLESTT